MAILRQSNTDARVSLGFRSLFGRGRKADFTLESSATSSEHASIYYMRGAWKVRDLGSLNGTWINEVRLEPSAAVPFQAGDTISFGSPVDGRWTLESSAPPGPSARNCDGHRIEPGPNGLWLPNSSAPLACVAWESAKWFVEDETGRRTVHDRQCIEICGEKWELELPSLDIYNVDPDTASTELSRSTNGLELHFTVSADEEHVAVLAKFAEKNLDLGARVHNYLLLMLARARLADRDNGVDSGEAGWLYADNLAELLSIDRKSMNLQLWRARQHFQKASVPGDSLIERREDSGQLRLGIDALRIAAPS